MYYHVEYTTYVGNHKIKLSEENLEDAKIHFEVLIHQSLFNMLDVKSVVLKDEHSIIQSYRVH